MRPTLHLCLGSLQVTCGRFLEARRLNQAPASASSRKPHINALQILRNQCYNSSVTPFGQALESMSRTRDEMRLYQRARRARLKAGTWSTAPKDAPPIARRPALAPAPASARTAIGGFPATLAGALPATTTGGLPHGTAPASPASMSGAQRPRLGAGPAAALSIAAPDTPSRRINSSPPHSADNRRMSKQCSPRSRRETMRESNA
jgi:hypothetical protein